MDKGNQQWRASVSLFLRLPHGVETIFLNDLMDKCESLAEPRIASIHLDAAARDGFALRQVARVAKESQSYDDFVKNLMASKCEPGVKLAHSLGLGANEPPAASHSHLDALLGVLPIFSGLCDGFDRGLRFVRWALALILACLGGWVYWIYGSILLSLISSLGALLVVAGVSKLRSLALAHKWMLISAVALMSYWVILGLKLVPVWVLLLAISLIVYGAVSIWKAVRVEAIFLEENEIDFYVDLRKLTNEIRVVAVDFEMFCSSYAPFVPATWIKDQFANSPYRHLSVEELKVSGLADPRRQANTALVGQCFELIVARFFSLLGFSCKLTDVVGDGGVDVLASRPRFTVGVQCKFRRSAPYNGWGDVIRRADADLRRGRDRYDFDHGVIFVNSESAVSYGKVELERINGSFGVSAVIEKIASSRCTDFMVYDLRHIVWAFRYLAGEASPLGADCSFSRQSTELFKKARDLMQNAVRLGRLDSLPPGFFAQT